MCTHAALLRDCRFAFQDFPVLQREAGSCWHQQAGLAAAEALPEGVKPGHPALVQEGCPPAAAVVAGHQLLLEAMGGGSVSVQAATACQLQLAEPLWEGRRWVAVWGEAGTAGNACVLAWGVAQQAQGRVESGLAVRATAGMGGTGTLTTRHPGAMEAATQRLLEVAEQRKMAVALTG